MIILSSGEKNNCGPILSPDLKGLSASEPYLTPGTGLGGPAGRWESTWVELRLLGHPRWGPRYSESQAKIAQQDQLRSAELTRQSTHSCAKIKVCCCSHWDVAVVCRAALFKKEVININSQSLQIFPYDGIKRKVIVSASMESLFFQFAS